MKSALIISGHVDSSHLLHIKPKEYDGVIAADKGYEIALSLGITPDIVIGDFDSSPVPSGQNAISLPKEKNMTDTEAAIDLAVQEEYTSITVLGGLGGRLDHTMGNLAVLRKYLGGPDVQLLDGQNLVFMKPPGRFFVQRKGYKYLGLFPYDSPCKGLSICGVKYPLAERDISNDTSLCVSNEITEEAAEISFYDGTLLVILSRDGG